MSTNLLINFVQVKWGQMCKSGLMYPKGVQCIKNAFCKEDGKSLVCVAVPSRAVVVDFHIIHLAQSIL